MRSLSLHKHILLGIVLGLVLLGCQITDTLTFLRPAPAKSPQAIGPTKTIASAVASTRPTFTPVPPTLDVPPTDVPPPIVPTNTAPRPSPTRTSPPRPTATRVVAAAPPPPTPTIDLYQGYFYRIAKNTCVAASNTRIEGTVFNNGAPQNGIRVRLSSGKYDIPVINDFITGTDPSDDKHIAPEWQGRYRLSPAEGQRIDGNWWVFIIDKNEQPLSVAAYVKTHDTAGCNTATVDFAH